VLTRVARAYSYDSFRPLGPQQVNYREPTRLQGSKGKRQLHRQIKAPETRITGGTERRGCVQILSVVSSILRWISPSLRKRIGGDPERILTPPRLHRSLYLFVRAPDRIYHRALLGFGTFLSPPLLLNQKATLLNKAVVGKGYKMVISSTTLTEPPTSYDSY